MKRRGTVLQAEGTARATALRRDLVYGVCLRNKKRQSSWDVPRQEV